MLSWKDRGFIKGKRGVFAYGQYKVWQFEYEDIEDCIRARPWLVNKNQVERGHCRNIVRAAWDADPWYTCLEAAPLLGLVDHNPVKRYIKRGWLKAEKRPGAGGFGEFIIRRSAIDEMLSHDPRLEHERHAFLKNLKARRKRWLDQGRPIAVMREWLTRCPICRHKVRIKADPNLRAPQIKQLFTDRYATGECTHGKRVLLMGEKEERGHKSRAKS